MNLTLLQGDWLERLRELPDESHQCCVTSPPYWGLRDYGVKGQLGLEKTPEEYVAKIVAGFREVRRVLRGDGTIWINLGDSYCATTKGSGGHNPKQDSNKGAWHDSRKWRIPNGLKAKDLVGTPWMVAFALRADGWYLRCDIIWSKPNPMPESVTDRPTRAHEYLFLMSKSARYFYDHEAIKEPGIYSTQERKDRARADHKSMPNGERNGIRPSKQRGHSRRHDGFNDRWDAMERKEQCSEMRNKRSVWNVAPANYAEAHFATFPPDLIKPCILAGSKAGDTILDPFGGSGTTGAVAIELGRKATLIELNPDYCAMIEQRCAVTPGLAL